MSRAGFTLLEISIVLVIVGLIIGGVLVGRDMIRSAAIRATISQFDMFNILVRTFRIKYNAVPGDMLPQQAGSFGFLQLSGGAKCGDQNGAIEAGDSAVPCGGPGGGGSTNYPVGENLTFWRHLSDAKLTDRTFGSDLASNGSAASLVPGTTTPSIGYLPASKIGNSFSWFVFSQLGVNYFGMMPISGLFVQGGNYGWRMPAWNATGTGISPVETYSIDSKIDDGMPNTGRVLAMDSNSMPGQANGNLPTGPIGIRPPTVALTSTADKCTIGTAAFTDTYNLNMDSGGNDRSCGLGFKFQ